MTDLAALPPEWSFADVPWLRGPLLEWVGEAVRSQAALGLADVLAGLRAVGRQIQRFVRDPWRARREPVDTAADAHAAALWRAWMDGSFWGIREAWERAYLADGARAFLAVAGSAHGRPRLRLDVRESFFQVCWDAPVGPAGWRKILARVAEAEGATPLAALPMALPVERRRSAVEALFCRGARADTAAMLVPEVSGARARARALASRLGPSLEAVVDTHVARRLVGAWLGDGEIDLELGWRIALQNQGRARSRLRAMVAQSDPPPQPRLAGLHGRTRYAVRRFFRDWARSQRPDFALGDATGVDPVSLVDDATPPLDAEDRRALRCWIMLGVLRGHRASLYTWIRTRQAGRTAAFYRFLNELPPALLSPRPGDRAGRDRVRVELLDTLDEHLERLRPLIVRVATLRAPRLAEKLRGCLAPGWAPSVPMPRGRTHLYVEHAARAARALDEEEES